MTGGCHSEPKAKNLIRNSPPKPPLLRREGESKKITNNPFIISKIIAHEFICG